MAKRTCTERSVAAFRINSALHGGGWSTSRTGGFTPGKKNRYPLNRKLGGPPSRSGGFEEEKNLFSFTGFRTPPPQSPYPSRHTDYVILDDGIFRIKVGRAHTHTRARARAHIYICMYIYDIWALRQCFSTFVRLRPGIFFY